VALLSVSTAGLSHGLDTRQLPERSPSELDDLRYRALVTRVNGEWDEWRETVEKILQQKPGDGYALREIALHYDKKNTILDLAAALESGDLSLLPVRVEFSAADIAYLDGLQLYYRSHHHAAREQLETAIQHRPGWGWAHYYLGRAKRSLTRPRQEWDPDLRVAFDDPEVNPSLVSLVLSWPEIADPRRDFPNYDELVNRLLEVQWTRVYGDWFRARDDLQDSGPNLARCNSVWESLEDRHGTTASLIVHYFADFIEWSLSTPAALEFYQRRISQGPLAGDWGTRYIDLLKNLGFWGRAWDLLRQKEPFLWEDEQLLVDTGGDFLPPEEYLAATDKLVAKNLAYTSVMTAFDAYEDLGEEERRRELSDRAAIENPVVHLSPRLYFLTLEDADAAAALLDSLADAGVPREWFASEWIYLSELSGDTASTREMSEWLVPHRASYSLARAASGAMDRGDRDRGLQLLKEAREACVRDVRCLNSLLQTAAHYQDKELALEIIDEMLSLCRECPMVGMSVVNSLIQMEEIDRARAEMKHYAASRDLDPSLAAGLSFQAEAFGYPDLVDIFVAAAKKGDEYQRDIRHSLAYLHYQRRELEEAKVIAKSLAEELPGVPVYQSLLMSIGGASTGPGEPIEPELGKAKFEGFGQDLESTDWILARRVQPDSFPNAMAVYLQVSTEYICSHIDGLAQRSREVIQILSQEAVEFYQSNEIRFRPSDGVPIVRQARVIHPDGRVVPVPRGDILVTGDRGEDVSDVRYLVVPFPGVRVGSVIDLVYDAPFVSLYGGGWSFRHVFVSELPTLEEVMEIRVAKGIPRVLHQSDGVPAPTERSTAMYDYYSWTLRELEALELYDLAPSFFDQYPWLGFSSFESWESAAHMYQDHFWEQIVVTDSIRGAARDAVTGKNSLEGKVQALLRFVSGEVHYLGIEIDRGRIIPTQAPEVLLRGYGDCKDMTALFIALLEASGIEAAPALVTEPDRAMILENFAEPNRFSHMVTYIPGLDGGRFIDVSTAADRGLELAPGLTGNLALVVPREGKGRLIAVPEATPEAHGFEMEVDFWPRAEKQLEIRSKARYRGDLAANIRSAISLADTTYVSAIVDRFLAYGLWATCQRTGWKILGDDSRYLSIEATYRDTAWSLDGNNSQKFVFLSEVSDPYITFPEYEERRLPVVLDSPYSNEITLRLHETEGWEISDRVAEFTLEGPFYGGVISPVVKNEDGNRHLELRQQFHIDRRQMSAKEYRRFYDDWLRYLVGIYQPFEYRKRINEEDIERLRIYASEHVSDYGFAIESVSSLLGGDVGGSGKSGQMKRDVSREMLTPLVASGTTGAMPCLLMATIEAREGRYRMADSLVTEGLRREPNNLFALGFQYHIKLNLSDLDGQIDILQKVGQQVGWEHVLLDYAAALHAAGREHEVEQLEARQYALSGEPDSTLFLRARLQGLQLAGTCEGRGEHIDALRGKVDDMYLKVAESSRYLTCDSIPQAVDVLEEIWKEYPLHHITCNNLAWAYARMGTKLDQALELVHASIILSDDPIGAENTLGLIYARQGEWKKAHRKFEELLELDDRPIHQAANLCMMGISSYELGYRSRAMEEWERGLDLAVEGDWESRITRCMALARQSKPVRGVLLVE
jgi:tetratricopeptide (TPR) repeat protein